MSIEKRRREEAKQFNFSIGKSCLWHGHKKSSQDPPYLIVGISWVEEGGFFESCSTCNHELKVIKSVKKMLYKVERYAILRR